MSKPKKKKWRPATVDIIIGLHEWIISYGQDYSRLKGVWLNFRRGLIYLLTFGKVITR